MINPQTMENSELLACRLEKIEELNKLQQSKNNGRGVNCIKDIIFYLKRGENDVAEAVCRNEGDKIESYPDLQKLIFNLCPVYKKHISSIAVMFGWKDITKN